jgi:hypothetical protein
MATYNWCSVCYKLIAEEMVHEDCEPNLRTKKHIEEVRAKRYYNDKTEENNE